MCLCVCCHRGDRALDSEPPAGKVSLHAARGPGQVSIIWQEKCKIVTVNLAEGDNCSKIRNKLHHFK